VPHKKVEANHSKKHDQRIGTPLLGEADMIRHKSQRECARKSDERRELFSKEIDHRYREYSSDQRNDSQIPFWFLKWEENMGEYKKKGRVKVCRVLFIEFYLAGKVIP
jgi:hypothetical protein